MQLGRDDIVGNDVAVDGYDYPADFSYSGTHELTLTLRIKATADIVVLARVGHIASRLDWGNANGVVNLNASP